jgi:DNA adenine methylase
MVVISGYACALYDEDLYHGWERHERATYADGARPRVEVVWLNPACSAARRGQTQGVLFGHPGAGG